MWLGALGLAKPVFELLAVGGLEMRAVGGPVVAQMEVRVTGERVSEPRLPYEVDFVRVIQETLHR